MNRPEAKRQFAKRTRSRIAARVFLEPGTSPGFLHPMPDSPAAVVTVLETKDGEPCSLYAIDDFTKLPQAATDTGVCWVRVVGLGALEPLLDIAKFYGISHLAMEDTLASGWRTKMELEDKYLFFVLQGPPYCDDRSKSDRLTLFCAKGLLITFESHPTRVVDHLWERLQETPEVTHTNYVAEFLTYMLLDFLVDDFFPYLDETDEHLATMEEVLLSHVPTRVELNTLYLAKRDIITLRRLITPFKEIRAELLKSHPPDILEDLKPFFSDLSDHIKEVDEMLDTYHEVTQSLEGTCQSIIGNRMNEIVRILTIISTIFMPLSLLAGIYGMNFKYMPELGWKYGYPAAWLIMAGMVGVMLALFKKRKWV